MKIRDKLLSLFCIYSCVVAAGGLICHNAAPGFGTLITFFLAVTAAASAVLVQIADSIVRPIKKIEKIAKNISMGDLSENVDTRGYKEFESLGASFNLMIERLKDTQNFLEIAVKMLQEKQDKLVESEKLASLGRLATGVAHEINNPIAIINEKAGLMKDILTGSPDFPKRDLFLGICDGIFTSVNRCRAITHHLLGYARPMQIVPELISIDDAVNEVLGFLAADSSSKQIVFELNFNKDAANIRSDKGQLQQVLLNIIKDAIDAVKEGGTISIWNDMKDEDTARIFIKDNGHGIPKDKLKHIFEPFFTTKERGKGTGLGLFVSYGIMNKLGGKILVESVVGKGTTFTIEIPLGFARK